MRICRFITPELPSPKWGVVEADYIRPLADSSDVYRNDFATESGGATVPLKSATLQAPVKPSKIVCVGRNYLDHALELGNQLPAEPLLFLKAPSALAPPGGRIRIPPQTSRVDFEGELAIVIGRRARKVGENDDPLQYVFGYSCLNDITARDLQRKDVQFTRAKSFDTFCPVGPWIETVADPGNLHITTRLNGIVRQDASTSQMAFSASYLIRYISQMMTLEPGDLIATGTPSGVGPISPGDLVEVEIEGLGVLRNEVEAD